MAKRTAKSKAKAKATGTPGADTSRVDGVLDAAYYPDILDGIVACAEYRVLLALRRTCRSISARAATHLMQHVVVSGPPGDETFRHPGGVRLPPSLPATASLHSLPTPPSSSSTTPDAAETERHTPEGYKNPTRVLEFARVANTPYMEPLVPDAVFEVVRQFPNVDVVRLHRHISWPDAGDIAGCPHPTTLVYTADMFDGLSFTWSRFPMIDWRVPPSVTQVVHQVAWRTADDKRVVEGDMFPLSATAFVLVFCAPKSALGDWYPDGLRPQHLKPILDAYVASMAARWAEYADVEVPRRPPPPSLAVVDPPPSDVLFGTRTSLSDTIRFRADTISSYLCAALHDLVSPDDAVDAVLEQVRVVTKKAYRAEVGNEVYRLHTAVHAKECV